MPAWYSVILLYSLENVLRKMKVRKALWALAVWINFFKKRESSWSNIKYYFYKFKLLREFDDQETTALYKQFIDYKIVKPNEFLSIAL